jgi:hypothetical protein
MPAGAGDQEEQWAGRAGRRSRFIFTSRRDCFQSGPRFESEDVVGQRAIVRDLTTVAFLATDYPSDPRPEHLR